MSDETTTLYVQFADEEQTKIITVFLSPQDPEYWPNMAEIQNDDPRYLAFLNPPVDMLALQSAKLLSFTQLAAVQKVSLADRISTLNDAVDLEMATPEEVAELPVRTTQLKQWKVYAVLLGRVTGHQGWPSDVTWPDIPEEGMDLSVAAVSTTDN